MSYFIHRADTRGYANHGWLQSYHTFSFASYHHPERVHFGALRVLNDDTVAAGMGFSTHAHKNMEIISIPLEGDLEHKDSMGNVAVIQHGDIQVMSAGSGIEHSEHNKHRDRQVKFLQIWIIPDQNDVTPRYGQMRLNLNDRHNQFQQVISPSADDAGLWIHQQAWFHMAKFDAGFSSTYTLKNKQHGLYIFVLHGELGIEQETLHSRDGMGIQLQDQCQITAKQDSEFLLMELPMFA